MSGMYGVNRQRAKRSDPEERRNQILQSAMFIARIFGHEKITRDAVALRCKVASSLVAKYFPKMGDLKIAVYEEALRIEDVQILSHCVGSKLSPARISPSLRNKIVKHIFR